jgi:hypothetical protein
MRVLRLYLERYGRPVAFYTDKASLFQTAPKNPRYGQTPRDQPDLPPTQIGRAPRIVRCLDRRSFTAGERARGTQLPDSAGSPGQRPSCGRSHHAGGSQPVSERGVSAVVESALGGEAGQSGRCASATGPGLRPERGPQRGGHSAGGGGLYDSLSGQDLSDRTRRGSIRTTRGCSAHRSTDGRQHPCSLSGQVPEHREVSTTAETKPVPRARSSTRHPPVKPGEAARRAISGISGISGKGGMPVWKAAQIDRTRA